MLLPHGAVVAVVDGEKRGNGEALFAFYEYQIGDVAQR